MHRTLLALSFAIGVTFLVPEPRHSQAQQPQTTNDILQALKKTNAELIEKQQKSMEALDKIEEHAKQLKIFGKRG